MQLRRPVAERLVAAAKDALPTRDAVVARRVLATDMALLTDLDAQMRGAEPVNWLSLLPLSPFATLTSVPKGRIRCRVGLWRTLSGFTPLLAWHPALRLRGSPNDAR